MKKLLYLIVAIAALGLIVSGCIPVVPSSEQDESDNIEMTSVSKVVVPIVIDGILSPGEWDTYYLGTSVTNWGGGTSVDVYGYADDTYLYAAYLADMNQLGWSLAEQMCNSNNLYYKTPQSADWPDPGYTLLAADGSPDDVLQTNGSGWENKGSFADNGVEIYSGDGCYNTDPNPNVAEVKIPLSLLTYEGDDGQIRLSGQYWQYDSAMPFYVELPPQIQICGTNLIAGNPKNETTVAGDVIVEYIPGDDHLTVTYNTEDGWLMEEIHFHVSTDDESGFPAKNGNPIPGQFDYKFEDLGGVDTRSFDIFLSEIGETGVTCDPLYFAAHAAVFKVIGDGCESPQWASEVIGNVQGTLVGGGPVTDLNRTDPEKALGPPDASTTLPAVGFYALGFVSNGDGWIELAFDYPIYNGSGYDIVINEVTWGRGSYPEEVADVYVIANGMEHYAGTVNSKDNNGIGHVSIPVGLVYVDSVKLVDATDPVLFGTRATADGYDLDAVGACYLLYQEESAWGEGPGFYGKNWAMYFKCEDFLPECQ